MTDTELTANLEGEYGAGQGPFYLCFISAENYIGIDRASDTMASHAGWQEFTGYTGDRPLWDPDAAAGKQIANSTPPTAVSTAAGTIMGYVLTDDDTKGGNTGRLVTHGMLDEPQAFASGKNLMPRLTIKARDFAG